MLSGPRLVSYIFQWNPQKAAANRRAHGVSFDEATEVFGDPFAINMSDPDHSVREERCILLRLSLRSRVLVVCYVERRDRTRIISARIASRAERHQYEEELHEE